MEDQSDEGETESEGEEGTMDESQLLHNSAWEKEMMDEPQLLHNSVCGRSIGWGNLSWCITQL